VNNAVHFFDIIKAEQRSSLYFVCFRSHLRLVGVLPYEWLRHDIRLEDSLAQHRLSRFFVDRRCSALTYVDVQLWLIKLSICIAMVSICVVLTQGRHLADWTDCFQSGATQQVAPNCSY